MRYAVRPANSDYANEIEFKVANEKGITSNVAECSVGEEGITVKARGDGEFWLRAMCKTALSTAT